MKDIGFVHLLKNSPKVHADKIKLDHFKNGATCECGEELNEDNATTKTKCVSREALENHIIFPTYSLLDNIEDFTQHWVLLVEIFTMHNFKNDPIKAHYRDPNNCVIYVSTFSALYELVLVSLQHIHLFNGENTFDCSELKTGHTMALLYAKRYKDNSKYNLFGTMII